MLPLIKVIDIKKCECASLSGDVVFYNCNPPRCIDNSKMFDISKDVLRYIKKNITIFNNYIRDYILKNGNDVRIAQSMLFEFHTLGIMQNKTLELIAIMKALEKLNRPSVTLVVSSDFEKELLYTAFTPAYQFKMKNAWLMKFLFRSLFYFFILVPAVKLKRMFQGEPENAQILFHSFITGDIREGFRIDPYLTPLVEELRKIGVRLNRFAFFATIKPMAILKAVYRLNPREFILPEAYMGLKDIWSSFRYTLSLKDCDDLDEFRFDGCNLTNYLKSLSQYQSVCCHNFRTDLMRRYIREFGVRYRAIVMQNENLFQQRALFKEAKDMDPKACRISYQNTNLYSYNPNSYYDIFPKEYRPDVIFTSGQFFKDYLTKKLNYPSERTRKGFSLNNIPQGTKYRKSMCPVLCVYVSDIFFEAQATLEYLIRGILPRAGEFSVGIRFHPYCAPEVLELFNGLEFFEYENAEDSLFRSDCFLSTGISTIILSAAMTGKPVYVLEVPNVPNWMECFELENISHITPEETFRVEFFSDQEYIDEDVGVSLEETCKEIVNLCGIEVKTRVSNN